MARSVLLVVSAMVVCTACHAQSGTVVSAAYPQEPTLYLPVAGDAVLQQRFGVHLGQGATTLCFAFGRLEIPLDALDVEVQPAEAACVSTVQLAPDAKDTVRLELEAGAECDATLVVSFPLKGIERRYAYSVLVHPESLTADVTAKAVLCNKSKLAFGAVTVVLPGGRELATALPQNETFEVTLFCSAGVAYEPVYIYDAPKWGGAIAAVMRFSREGEDAFSAEMLQSGKMSFATGAAPNAWVGEDTLPVLPPHGGVDVRPGNAPDLGAARRLTRSVQVDLKSDVRDRLVLYNVEEDVELEARNSRATPVTVQMRDTVSGNWEMVRNSAPFVRVNAETVEFPVELAPGEVKVVSYGIKRMNLQP